MTAFSASTRTPTSIDVFQTALTQARQRSSSPTWTGSVKVIRSTPAVTTRLPQCRIAAIPATSSHILITTPPWTNPAELASWMLIQRISSELDLETGRPSPSSLIARDPSRTTLPPTLPRHGDITVVIPCFNHGRFLLESVERALGQQGGPPRVLVVDDGSTDEETQRALEELPKEVRLIRQENAGAAAARNAGFENSDSELLLMVDADDRLTVDALDVLRPPLESHPDVGYCYGLMKLIGAWSGVLRFPDFDPYILLHRSIGGAQLGVVRRRCWEDAGGFDPAIDGYEDWDFCLSALEKGWRGLQINRVTHEYRKHERSGEEEHRRRYRHVYRQIRRKHPDLFARRSEFAAQSDLGPLHRLVYRTFWAWRPVPARLEKALYRNVLFRRGAAD